MYNRNVRSYRKINCEANLKWFDSSTRFTNENGFNRFRINRSMFCNKESLSSYILMSGIRWISPRIIEMHEPQG